jgi:DNA-binding protein YbaB
MFRKSRLPQRCSAGSCSGLVSVEALVKLEFIPVKYDTDLVLISNQDALSDMMLAVKYSNAGDKEMAKDFEAKAIREMNLELNNKFPSEQTPIIINGFGSALPTLHGIGSII